MSVRASRAGALRDAQADLARAARLATMGELSTLIAHEVSSRSCDRHHADTCCHGSRINPNPMGRARRGTSRPERHRAGAPQKHSRAWQEVQAEMANSTQTDREILAVLRSELRAKCFA